MATSQQSSGVKSDPGIEINPLRNSQVDGKSFIVGKYDEWGGRRALGKAADTGEVSKEAKLMQNSMKTRGGELMRGFIMTNEGPVKASQYTPRPKPAKPAVPIKPVLAKTKRKKKEPEPEVEQNYIQMVEENINPEVIEYDPVPQPVKTETFPVTFSIESGTIKSQADAILEDELGLILVYKDLDSISYVPKRGGKLSLSLPGRNIQVMYLGIQAQWYNTNQQLLLFVKTEPRD